MNSTCKLNDNPFNKNRSGENTELTNRSLNCAQKEINKKYNQHDKMIDCTTTLFGTDTQNKLFPDDSYKNCTLNKNQKALLELLESKNSNEKARKYGIDITNRFLTRKIGINERTLQKYLNYLIDYILDMLSIERTSISRKRYLSVKVIRSVRIIS